VGKTYRPWEPSQSFLFPPSPRDWLPEDHLAFFILDVVTQLDLSAIVDTYEKELRGYPPHDPRMMVALLLYAYCVGVPSSRKIEKRTHEDVAFRVIAAENHPDHVRISEFRRRHIKDFGDLFVQVLRLCQKAKLVKLGNVALDGTKMKANASKHKAMSYARMKQEEKALREKVKGLLRAAENADSEEDDRYGRDRRGDELPEELQRTESRRARIRELRAELEAEARAQASDSDDNEPPSAGGTPELPEHKIKTTADGKPAPKAQRNFTDGDSRIMKTGKEFLQGYNCQAAVDEAHQIIVAQAVTNQPTDVGHLAPMLEQLALDSGRMPTVTTADSGYYSEENVAYATNQGTELLSPAPRQMHKDARTAELVGSAQRGSLKHWMERKLASRRGARLYSRRKVIVEPVFGQIKAARGLRSFLLRGLEKVRGEWSLITLTHNLLKLSRAWPV